MPKNIALIIEDNADLSEIFSRALQTAGFEVEAILDGKIAETRLKEIVPNVIVLDMHLPSVDGPTLLKQIHADERCRKFAQLRRLGRGAMRLSHRRHTSPAACARLS